jgi:hypothetical protein
MSVVKPLLACQLLEISKMYSMVDVFLWVHTLRYLHRSYFFHGTQIAELGKFSTSIPSTI